jgi:hypothetical protein
MNTENQPNKPAASEISPALNLLANGEKTASSKDLVLMKQQNSTVAQASQRSRTTEPPTSSSVVTRSSMVNLSNFEINKEQ